MNIKKIGITALAAVVLGGCSSSPTVHNSALDSHTFITRDTVLSNGYVSGETRIKKTNDPAQKYSNLLFGNGTNDCVVRVNVGMNYNGREVPKVIDGCEIQGTDTWNIISTSRVSNAKMGYNNLFPLSVTLGNRQEGVSANMRSGYLEATHQALSLVQSMFVPRIVREVHLDAVMFAVVATADGFVNEGDLITWNMSSESASGGIVVTKLERVSGGNCVYFRSALEIGNSTYGFDEKGCSIMDGYWEFEGVRIK